MSKPDDKHPSRTEGAESSGKDLGPVDYLKAARAQLRIGNNDQAYRILLQAAVDYPDNALILSYYGCLQALVDGRYQSGIAACKKAIAVFQAPDKYSVGVIYPILYLNLGRACLAAGRKKDAVEAFTKGLKYDKSHREIKKDLQHLGMRKPPAVPFLSRSNPINKYIGRLLHGSEEAARPRAGR
jgi:tetratricopeptide (TPR) repeat protein